MAKSIEFVLEGQCLGTRGAMLQLGWFVCLVILLISGRSARGSSASVTKMDYPLLRPFTRHSFTIYANGSSTAVVHHNQHWISDHSVKKFTGPPVRIAGSISLQVASKYAVSGKAMLQGYEMFMVWVNSINNGILVGGLRRPVQLDIIDDRSNATNVEEIYNYYVDNGTNLFVGPYGQFTGEAVAVAESRGAVLVSPSAADPKYFFGRQQSFSVVPSANSWGISIMSALRAKGATTAVIVQETDFPETMCQYLPVSTEVHGIAVPNNTVLVNSNNISTAMDILQDIAQVEQPDILVGCTSDDLCISILQELKSREHYLDFKALVFTFCVTSKDFQTKLPDTGRWVIGVTPWFHPLNTTSQVTNFTTADVTAIHKWRYNEFPTPDTAAAFVACVAIYDAIVRAKSSDPANVSAALRSINISTLFGDLFFNNSMGAQSILGIQQLEHHTTGLPPRIVISGSSAGVSHIQAPLVYPMPSFRVRECFNPSVLLRTNIVGLSGAGNLTCDLCPPGQLPHWIYEGWHGISAWFCSSEGMCLLGQREVRSNITNMAICIDCPNGTYGTAQTCLLCQGGKFSNITRSTECTHCPVGRISHVGSSLCVDCPPGRETSSRVGPVAVTGGTQSNTAGPLSNSCRECEPGTNRSGGGLHFCVVCPSGFAAPQAQSANCTPCPPGSHSIWGATACPSCEPGKYQSTGGRASCLDCPAGSACKSSGTVSPANLADYWEFFDESIADPSLRRTFVPCEHRDLCLENGACAKGHTGIQCSVCLPRYSFSVFDYKCYECPGGLVNFISTLCLMVIFTVVCLLLTRGAIHGVFETKAMTSALFKALLNYITTMSFMATVLYRELQFKGYLRARHNDNGYRQVKSGIAKWFNSNILEVQASLFSLECLVEPSLSNYEKDIITKLGEAGHTEFLFPQHREARNALSQFHRSLEIRRIFLWAAIPVILAVSLMLFGVVVLWIHLRWYKQYYADAMKFFRCVADEGWQHAIRTHHTKDSRAYMISFNYRLFGIWRVITLAGVKGSRFRRLFFIMGEPLWVVIVFVTFPAVMKAYLRPLSCVQPADGKFGDRIESATDVECYDSSRLFWFGLGLVVTFGIGVPSAACIGLWEHRDKLSRDRYKRTYGFLTTGYEVDCKGWECFVLIRKTVGASVASLGMDASLRVWSMLFASMFFFIMHVFYQPFDNRFMELLDVIEWRHLICWVIWCFGILGIHMLEDSTPEYIYNVFIFSLGAIHVFFLLMIGKHLFRHVNLISGDAALDHAWREQSKHLLQGADVDSFGTDFELKCHAVEVLDQSTSTRERLTLYFYIQYYDKIPYTAFSHDLLWTQLCGNKSTKGELPLNFASEDRVLYSPVVFPPGVKPMSDWQKGLMLSIISEAMEYVIVNSEINVFSANLLEFVIRAGYAWGSDGHRRTVTLSHVAHRTMRKQVKHKKNVGNASIPLGIVRKFKSGFSEALSLAASSRPSRPSGLSFGSEQSADQDASRNLGLNDAVATSTDAVAARSGTWETHDTLEAREAEIRDEDVTVVAKSIQLTMREGLKAVHHKMSKTSTGDTDCDDDDDMGDEPSDGKHGKPTKKPSQLLQEFYIPDVEVSREGRHISELFQEVCTWMFDEHIYHRGLCVQDWHLNLAATLMAHDRHQVMLWLDIFEETWYTRMLEIQMAKDAQMKKEYEEVSRTISYHCQGVSGHLSDTVLQVRGARIDEVFGEPARRSGHKHIRRRHFMSNEGLEIDVAGVALDMSMKPRYSTAEAFHMIGDELGAPHMLSPPLSPAAANQDGRVRMTGAWSHWERITRLLLHNYLMTCQRKPFLHSIAKTRGTVFAKKFSQGVLERELQYLQQEIENAKEMNATHLDDIRQDRNEINEQIPVAHGEHARLRRQILELVKEFEILAEQLMQQNNDANGNESPTFNDTPPDTGRSSNPTVTTDSTVVPDSARRSLQETEISSIPEAEIVLQGNLPEDAPYEEAPIVAKPSRSGTRMCGGMATNMTREDTTLGHGRDTAEDAPYEEAPIVAKPSISGTRMCGGFRRGDALR